MQSHLCALLQEFVENVNLQELLVHRDTEYIEEEEELQQEEEEFHTEFGSEEEIYDKAQEAAAGYLAELGVEEEEEDEDEDEDAESEIEEITEEDWADTPGMLP